MLSPPGDEPAAAAPDWHGFTAVGPVAESAAAAPEPDAPQGEYGAAPAAVSVALPQPEIVPTHPVELLAPAGGPDAAFAAFHYGADAIYLGLKKFSARAEAENFTLDEVRRGHRLRPQPDAAPPRLRHHQHAHPPGRTGRAGRGRRRPRRHRRRCAHHPGPGRLSPRPPALSRAGAARQHAAGRPQPGRGGGAAPARLHARRAGPRADLRGSPRHHRRRRASRRRSSSTGRCAIPTAACACSRRRRSAAAATAANAPIPAAIRYEVDRRPLTPARRHAGQARSRARASRSR